MTTFISNMIPINGLRHRAGFALQLVFVGLVTCTLAACSRGTLASDLPPGVVDVAEQALPGYVLPSTAEPDSPHVGFGDFDANGLEDVVALLQGNDDWQLVVFRQMDSERYQTNVIEQFPGDDRAFKTRLPADDLELEALAKGETLEIDGKAIEGTTADAASLVLHLPAAEQTALQFTWNQDHQLFGASRLRLAAAANATTCAYDPQSGEPNPLGSRAFVTVEEQDGSTVIVYERFPENLAGTAPATIATRRALTFHQTSIDQARAFMREEPIYYRELTGDDDPAGFAPVDASLTCQ